MTERPDHIAVTDLLDEQGAAEVLGIAWQFGQPAIDTRFPGIPAPIADFGPKRPRLWSRAELTDWIKTGGINAADDVKVVRYVGDLLCVVLDPLPDEARRAVERALNGAPKVARKPRTDLLAFLMAGVTLPAVTPGMRRANETVRRSLVRGMKMQPALLPLDGSPPIDTISKTIYKYVGDYLISNPQVLAAWPGFGTWWRSTLMAHTDEGPVLWGVADGGLAD